MKKGQSNHVPRLIVDEFQKIRSSQCQPSAKSSYSTGNNLRLKKKTEVVKCWHCKRLFPAETIPMHEKMCQVNSKYEHQYDLMHSKREQKKAREEERKPECNYDYYPIVEIEESYRENRNAVNISKNKRPMSAMNKKIETKPKQQIKVHEREESKLKKATSTSKLKEEFKQSRHASKEKGEKSKQSSKYEHVYLKNIGMEKKHPLSIGPSNPANASKLKKKNVNTAQKFIKKEERSIEERSLRRPESRSKKEERPVIKEKRRFEQAQNQEQQELIRRKHKEQARLDPPQITTQKLREMVREKLREEKEEEREKRRQPVQTQRRENIRQPNRQQARQQRQPMRTEARNQREPPQRQPRQPRPNRNQSRNRNFQRYPRRQASRNQQPSPLFNLVSQTISNQLEMINNQFSVMSNIFENFSNYVNINIESYPNHYQFMTHDLNTSSQYNSDSSNSYSSDYDDYYEESQPEGMDEEQLNSIQDKRYRVEQHGQNQCTICLAELKNGDIIKQLYCDHLFHSQCIQEWLRRKSACPVCRDQLGSN